MPRSTYALVAAIATLILVPSTAQAQTEWERQVRAQLELAGESFMEEGYVLTHTSTEYALEEGEEFALWVELEGGVEYAIIGVCDADCSDLDLEIFDSEANSIDSDYELDDYPVLAVIPNYSTRFRIQVSMATCSVEPCSWGVGVFGK